MIKTEFDVPEVYYRESRDFQFLGRVFDVVFNSTKTNSDLVETNPLSDNFDTRMIDLLTLTLGFKSRHHYNTKQLTAMCSAFTKALRCKGTQQSIEIALETLLRAEGITKSAKVYVEDDISTMYIYVPVELSDTNLLKDLFDYLLPAGMKCEVVKQLAVETQAQTDIIFTGKGIDGADQFNNSKHWAAQTSIVPGKGVADTSATPSNARAGLVDNTTVVGATIPPEEE